MENCVTGEARGSVMAVINLWKLQLGNRRNRGHLGNIAVSGAITLRWIFKEEFCKFRSGLVCSRTGAMLRCSEHNVKLYDSIKDRQFFLKFRN